MNQDIIEGVTIPNSDINGQMNAQGFDTTDYVYIESFKDVTYCHPEARGAVLTDFAIALGAAKASKKNRYAVFGENSAIIELRSMFDKETIDCVSEDGQMNGILFSNTNAAYCPIMNISVQNFSKNLDAFNVEKATYGNGARYATFEFGYFPQKHAPREVANKISSANECGKFLDFGLYEYEGKKYVGAWVKPCQAEVEMSSGEKITIGSFEYFEVQPIKWKIVNWNNLPSSVNPAGTGEHSRVRIRTDRAIIPNLSKRDDLEEENAILYQNSWIRAYLNGYNLVYVNNYNGNSQYKINKSYDYSKTGGFLKEALDFDAAKISQAQVAVEQKPKKRKRAYGIRVQREPLTIDGQIEFYIKNGQSFMLHGPSGVGKSRRIEDADPNFVSIVLRNGILPEEVIGKTIYKNDDKSLGGEWRAPAWYLSLLERCEKEPEKNHVLFIDEITNVKPSEQSLVFHIVLNHSIGPNYGKLPKNCVVVAAGNSMEESEAAYNMPEPLFRRFEAHIELVPDIKSFLDWGSKKSRKNPERTNIHPLVASYVASVGQKVFYTKFDPENPPKFAIDPRGWEQISDMIYDNDGVIAKELIENKVGPDITASFVEFAKNPPLMLEDILDGAYEDKDIPSKFDVRYALILSLRYATEDELPIVRDFISKHLGKEMGAIYDSIWVGKDNEKAIFIEQLKQEQIVPERVNNNTLKK